VQRQIIQPECIPIPPLRFPGLSSSCKRPRPEAKPIVAWEVVVCCSSTSTWALVTIPRVTIKGTLFLAMPLDPDPGPGEIVPQHQHERNLPASGLLPGRQAGAWSVPRQSPSMV
jgi:hypothetical protein